MNVLQRLREKRGQGLVEYVLIIALIAIICMGLLRTLGNSANDKLDEINTEISS